MWSRIEGWILVPHELLHIAAYRITGKRYRYRLGDVMVQGEEEKSWREQLFILLLPFVVNVGLLLLVMVSWFGWYLHARYSPDPLVYFSTAPVWHQLLWWAGVGLALYTSTCVLDIQMALRLLVEQLTQQPPNQPNKRQDERKRPQHTN